MLVSTILGSKEDCLEHETVEPLNAGTEVLINFIKKVAHVYVVITLFKRSKLTFFCRWILFQVLMIYL